jgi:heme A synthase
MTSSRTGRRRLRIWPSWRRPRRGQQLRSPSLVLIFCLAMTPTVLVAIGVPLGVTVGLMAIAVVAIGVVARVLARPRR